MDRFEMDKLLKDIKEAFPDNYGMHFAKSINMQLMGRRKDEVKEELITVIEHLVNLLMAKP